jgi:hypothetical protein
MNTAISTPVVSERLEYGKPLTIPNTPKFTLKQLRSANRGVKYITLYVRVQKLLARGELAVVGETRGKVTHRRGRSAKQFARVEGKNVTSL